jgi:hypothetical protein
MTTFACPGYEDHPCGKTVERTSQNQKFCRECSQEQNKAYQAAYRAAHEEEHKAYRAARKEEKKAYNVAYRAAHKEELKAYNDAYSAAHKEERKAYNDGNKEERSVGSHHRRIFGTEKNHPLKNYEGMSFEDTWNPKKGGSFRAGGDWIIANLGRKPEGCSLHVIDHAKGFVAGNLEWTHPVKQSAEQMFKIIARQRHEIKELQIENQKLRAEIQETKTRAA